MLGAHQRTPLPAHSRKGQTQRPRGHKAKKVIVHTINWFPVHGALSPNIYHWFRKTRKDGIHLRSRKKGIHRRGLRPPEKKNRRVSAVMVKKKTPFSLANRMGVFCLCFQ